MSRRKTNEEFQEELKQLRNRGRDVYCDELYVTNRTRMTFYCSKNHMWPSTPNHILGGHGCPYCSGRLAIPGETDLATVRPDVAALLKDKSHANKLTCGSNRAEEFVCPFCKREYVKIVNNVCREGFTCKFCTDGISFPEKVCRSMLCQLDVEDLDFEWNPKWLKPYFYDAYFRLDDKEYVVEMDGGIAHGHKVFGKNEVDVDGKTRDNIKDDLALKHHVIVIRIDCCYGHGDKFEYIKNNILHSELSSVLKLDEIDWAKCCEEACTPYTIKAAQLYNIGWTVGDIKDFFKCTYTTVRNWLQTASNAGLCQYNSSTARSRGLSKGVNQYTPDGVFVATYKSQKEASEMTGIKAPYINAVIHGRNHRKTAGGYFWVMASNPDQPDKTKIIQSTIQN